MFTFYYFLLDSGKMSLQLKYILNLASVTFFLKCCACLALRLFFAQIYCAYIFVELTGISPAWNFSGQNLVLLQSDKDICALRQNTCTQNPDFPVEIWQHGMFLNNNN